MNRTQKQAWWVLIWVGAGMLAAGIAMGVLYFKFGFPKAQSGIAFLAIGAFGGLAPLLFRKDPGPVQFDERDREIQLKSARAGFAMSYLVFGLLAMGIWGYCRRHSMVTISIEVLPMIWMLAGMTMFFCQALMTLLLYGKDNKAKEGDAA